MTPLTPTSPTALERDAASYPYQGFELGSLSMRLVLYGEGADWAVFACRSGPLAQ